MPKIPLETAELFQNSITELEPTESALEQAWDELEKQTAETLAELIKSGAANAQEISDRFAAAKQLRSSLKTQRKQAADRLEFHLANSPMAVIEWDSEFRVRRWSPQAEQIFGWKTAEIIGKYWYEWPIVYSADFEEVKLITNKLLDGSESRNIGLNRNYTKDGSIVYCEWYNSALRDAEGDRLLRKSDRIKARLPRSLDKPWQHPSQLGTLRRSNRFLRQSHRNPSRLLRSLVQQSIYSQKVRAQHSSDHSLRQSTRTETRFAPSLVQPRRTP
jgi:PAS domain S-box